MRILQINNHHRIVGGSDAVFFNTAELLRQAGHEVVLFAATSDADLPSPYARFFPPGLEGRTARPTDFFNYIHNRDAARALERLIAAEGPFEVAHLHIYYGRLTAAILPVLKKHGIRVVQTLHEYKLACPIFTMERNGHVCEACIDGSSLNLLRHRCKGNNLVKSLVVFAEYWASRLQGDVRHIDTFICVSDFQRSLMERADIPRRKLATLHNFVDPESFAPVSGQETEDYLFYFGRIEKLKGVGTLIQAAKATGARAKIAGTGSWSQEMLKEIADFPHIQAVGHLSGELLKDLIARARAVVVPSEWYENCPMSILEAKAAGTPVIGARIGGIPELVRDGTDGLLFEPGNADDLARAISELDQIDLSVFGASAREDIISRFSPTEHRSRLLAIFGAVLGEQ